MPKRVQPPTLDEVLKDMNMPLEEFATGVAKISRGMQVLSESRLRPDTIIMLVAKASGESQERVKRVLEALPSLESRFLKPEKK